TLEVELAFLRDQGPLASIGGMEEHLARLRGGDVTLGDFLDGMHRDAGDDGGPGPGSTRAGGREERQDQAQRANADGTESHDVEPALLGKAGPSTSRSRAPAPIHTIPSRIEFFRASRRKPWSIAAAVPSSGGRKGPLWMPLCITSS